MAKGHDCTGLCFLCLQVLPMGWISAVGIMQAVHRRLMKDPVPRGAGLPSSSEIRKTMVLPIHCKSSTKCDWESEQRLIEGWQVYLDNFAALSVTSRSNLKKAQGQLSQWHALARSTWEKWNIPSAKDKSVASSLHAKELGCEIDGERGTLGPTCKRRLDAIMMSLFIISSDQPHRMWLAVVAERWNFCFQFRRPVSSVCCQVWRAI